MEKTEMGSPVRSEVPVSTAVTTPPSVPLAFDFLDLKAQFAAIRGDVMPAIQNVMESQIFIMGNEVQSFEREFAQAFHAKFAISCASGTDALILALKAASVGPGDEVITTPFTFVASAGAIANVGAKPVFVDIDPVTFNIDPQGIAAVITPRTRAIMPVHLFGLAANLKDITKIADAHGLIVIEDGAQAVGAKFDGQYVGNIGQYGCFSFFPSKNLGGAGDGGMITTSDPKIADRLKLIRVHGSRTKYQHEILGTNSRLDALQAAILRVKLRHLETWTTSRNARAERYRELFEQAGLTQKISIPVSPSAQYRHVYNQFTIRCPERDGLRDFVRARGIPTEIYYPRPLHLQPAFSHLGYQAGQFPQAEAASEQVLSLPVFPELTEAQQTAIVQSIADFYA
jgi:dTDP-4-amino-4,6-dideoxygalactose transaminase